MLKKFLLHVCCAPCSVAVIDELRQNFEVTVLFYNPNIYPLEEYQKRKKEVMRVCVEWGIQMVDVDYQPLEWFKAIEGLEKELEGGTRCVKCFRLRLECAAKYAKEYGFDCFGTSLTSGRNKKANVINPIGIGLGKEYGVEFFVEDWKKAGRQDKARKMIKERNIYRQDYCGCIYSYQTRYGE